MSSGTEIRQRGEYITSHDKQGPTSNIPSLGDAYNRQCVCVPSVLHSSVCSLRYGLILSHTCLDHSVSICRIEFVGVMLNLTIATFGGITLYGETPSLSLRNDVIECIDDI